MKAKIFLLFTFFTLKTYAQNNQVTVQINNSVICNSQAFSGMVLQNSQYLLQYGNSNMWLGYVNSNNENAVYRGYQEFNVNSLQTVPPDITSDNITSATLLGELQTSTQSNSTVNIYRHDSGPFNCSNVNATGWNYLAGGGGMSVHIAAFNFGNNHKDEEVDVLSQVKQKRQNGKLILCYRNASESTHNLYVFVKLNVTYNLPPAPSNAPPLTCNFKTQTGCTLNWPAVQGPLLGYKVYQAGKSNPILLDASTTSVNITGLQENTTYKFYIRAYNSGGDSPTSAELSVTTPSISGSNVVCYGGSEFVLNNAPPGLITWSVDKNNIFNVNSSGIFSAMVYRKGSSVGNATLTAKINGQTVATKIITPCDPVTISGPANVCPGSSATFTINNRPSNTTTTWSIPASLTVSTQTDSYVTVTCNGNLQTVGNISAAFIQNGNLVTNLMQPVSINSFRFNISGPDYIRYTGTGTYSVNPDVNNCPSNIYYEWRLNDVLVEIGDMVVIQSMKRPMSQRQTANLPTGNNSDVNVYGLPVLGQSSSVPHAVYLLVATARNSSGQEVRSSAISIEIFGYPNIMSRMLAAPINSAVAAYPNPASDLLNIEIDPEAAAQQVQSVALEQTTTAKQLKQDKTFDIRLYDGQGNLLRQKKTKGGTVQFNVSSLPAGIYYLHIYDGVNEKPEMRQIVVEH